MVASSRTAPNACEALAVTRRRSDVQVVWRQRVPVSALRPLFRWRHIAAPLVHHVSVVVTLCAQLQVLRVAARRVITHVHHNHPIGNWADEKLVHNSMGQFWSSLPHDAPVAVYVASARVFHATRIDFGESRQKQVTTLLVRFAADAAWASAGWVAVSLESLVVRTAKSVLLDFNRATATFNHAHVLIIQLGHVDV